MDTLGVDEQTIEYTQPITTNAWNIRALTSSAKDTYPFHQYPVAFRIGFKSLSTFPPRLIAIS